MLQVYISFESADQGVLFNSGFCILAGLAHLTDAGKICMKKFNYHQEANIFCSVIKGKGFEFFIILL